MEYFSHDYNAREDEKIQSLIFKHGFEGYGLYWALIEMLYQNDGFIEPECERIAFALHTHNDLIEHIINDFGLFSKHGKRITSKSVLHRLRKRKGKSEKARQAAYIRWNQQVKPDADAMQTHSECNANKEKKSIVKKSIVNIKEKEEEFRTLVFSFDYNKIELEKFFNYWSEPNKSNTKMRCELQPTFDINRRLITWMNKVDVPRKSFKKLSPTEQLAQKRGLL